jgi:hypothetical protein
MARQQFNPKGPTLSPERGMQILQAQIDEAVSLRGEPFASPLREEWEKSSEGALRNAFGEDSELIQPFATASCVSFRHGDPPQRLTTIANQSLDGMLAVLRSAVKQLGWTIPTPTQSFIPAGSPHDAFVEIRKIIEKVTSEVLIVDSYVDDTLWPLLTNVPPNANIRILTMTMKGDFVLEGRKFAKQYGKSIAVRTDSTFHDRFIFIDGIKCWHLGASIKDAGTKAFALSEFFERQIATSIKQAVEATWNVSTLAPL